MRRISLKIEDTTEPTVPLKENKISAFRIVCELSIIGGCTNRNYRLLILSLSCITFQMSEREEVLIYKQFNSDIK